MQMSKVVKNSSHVVERIEVQSENLFFQEHQARYEFAKAFVQPGVMLDIACGNGYGCDLLQPICDADVIGVDLDLPTLSNARQTYSQKKINFLSGSGTEIPFADRSFYTITSMETLEHIANDHKFLRELARVMQPNGVCIITTPNKLYSLSHHITNPFHMREYDEASLYNLLSQYFGSVSIYHQGFAKGYHNEVRLYAQTIQERKRNLNSLTRFAIENIYRPVKNLLPTSITNFAIKGILGLSYPQPEQSQITISSDVVEDCSNFVVICKQPL